MVRIKVVDEGFIYRNPLPQLQSRQAYFPTVVQLDSGTLVASFQVGEASESVDAHNEIARSDDGGKRWNLESSVWDGKRDRPPRSYSLRLSRTRDGILLCYGARWDRSNPDLPIANPATSGMLPNELVFFTSRDGGRAWQGPRVIEPPMPGPFEIGSGIVVLKGGRWLAPFSTWKNWDGHNLSGPRAMILCSSDGGSTWPELYQVAAHPSGYVGYWEQRIIELERDRLLAVFWVHDLEKDEDLPNHYAFSNDGGRTWSEPRSTGMWGQTCSPLWLDNGKLLCVYNHRYGEPGVRAALVDLDQDHWTVKTETALWGVGALRGSSANAIRRRRGTSLAEEFASFTFGLPSAIQLLDGDYLAVYWCVEQCVACIRWSRLRLV
jgi:hypothetical protein